MIDTITFIIDGTLRHEPEGWKRSYHISETYFSHTRRFTHLETGLRIQERKVQGPDPEKNREEKVMSVEVSLPRLLGKCNFYQIRPTDYPLCLQKLESLLSEAVIGLRMNHLTRIDVCFQIRHSTPEIIDLHRTVKHSRIKKETEVYGTKGLTWPGKERRIRIYDKLRESFKKSLSGPICRIEAQYRGKAINEMFGQGDRGYCLTDVCFDKCYQALRQDMLCISPKARLIDDFTWLTFLAFEGHRKVPATEMTWFDYWAIGKSPETIRKNKRYLQSFRRATSVFSWTKVMPEKLTDVHFVEPTQEEILEYCRKAGVKLVA